MEPDGAADVCLVYPTNWVPRATARALADLDQVSPIKGQNVTSTFLNRLTTGLASVRRALAGPCNTGGQPLSVAGHLVFGACDKPQGPALPLTPRPGGSVGTAQ